MSNTRQMIKQAAEKIIDDIVDEIEVAFQGPRGRNVCRRLVVEMCNDLTLEIEKRNALQAIVDQSRRRSMIKPKCPLCKGTQTYRLSDDPEAPK